jgi:hypothetical protein
MALDGRLAVIIRALPTVPVRNRKATRHILLHDDLVEQTLDSS